MTEADAQELLKKRARRRLIGAVAFAVLAALLLPLVMDGPPPPPASEVQIRIPAPGEPPASRDARQSAQPQVVGQIAALAPPPDSARATESEKVKAASASGTAAAPESAEGKAEAKTVEAAPATPDAAPAQGKSAAQKGETQKGEVQKGEAQKTAEAKNGRDAPRDTAKKAEHVILIGAYANPANVRNIQAKLKELGVRTYTEPLDAPDGKKTRVRGGPFASREEAEKALAKMKRIGVDGTVSTRQ